MAEKTVPALQVPAAPLETTSLKPPFAPRPIPPKPPFHVSPTAAHQSGANGDLIPQPVYETSILLTPFDSLPTIFGRGSKVEQVQDEIKAFIEEDLDLSRLNRIHGHLWMAGRPMRARPLHRYKMLGYEVLCTQQMDLHLLQFSNNLMLKPLTEYMLDYEFWQSHICEEEGLHKSACGFLLSYIWLLTSPLDLKLAHDAYLVPSFITWHWWKDFVRDYASNIDIDVLHQVNVRYHFGDLRLGRINSIYRTRFMFTHFIRGYLYGYNRYVIYFQRNFGWILIVFVFFSLVLSAMQVGAGIVPLDQNYAFIRSCYVFVVFSVISCAAVLGFVGILFCFIFIYNMFAAISHAKTTRRERKKQALNRQNGKKDA